MFKRSMYVAALYFIVATLSLTAEDAIKPLSFSNAQAAAEKTLEKIETKYGVFQVKTGTKAEMYDSGAIKSFYLEGKQTIKLSVGKFDIETPLNWAGIKNQPLEFYENGNIKKVYLGPHSTAGSTTTLPTPVGDLLCRTRYPIEFHENECLKLVVVAGNQSSKFLTSLDSKAKFKDSTEIEFYDDGKLKTFTPTVGFRFTEELTSKPNNPIALTSDGLLMSFVPMDSTSLDIESGIVLNLYKNQPVEFYENGSFRCLTVKLNGLTLFFNEIGIIGNPQEDDLPTYTNANGMRSLSAKTLDTFVAKLEFYEGFKLKEISVLEEENQIKTILGNPLTQEYNDFNVVEIDGKRFCVDNVKFGSDGSLETIEYYSKKLPIISEKKLDYDKKMGSGTETLYAKKDYFNKGKKVAAFGLIQKIYGQHFYDTTKGCVIVYDGDKASKIIDLKSTMNFDDCEIFLDKNGTPVGYSIKDNDRMEIK